RRRLHHERVLQGAVCEAGLARRPRPLPSHGRGGQQGHGDDRAPARVRGLERRLRGRQERDLPAQRTPPVKARVHAGTLAILAVYAAITAAATGAALNMEPFGVLVRDGRVDGLQDFASHRGFACAVWSGDAAKAGGTSAYTLPAHLQATERWSHMSPRIALPFGYSPTMTWILD